MISDAGADDLPDQFRANLVRLSRSLELTWGAAELSVRQQVGRGEELQWLRRGFDDLRGFIAGYAVPGAIEAMTPAELQEFQGEFNRRVDSVVVQAGQFFRQLA